METAESYAEALNLLSSTKLMSPVYFILGGRQSGEGVIITRGLTEEADKRVYLQSNKTNGWYKKILQKFEKNKA